MIDRDDLYTKIDEIGLLKKGWGPYESGPTINPLCVEIARYLVGLLGEHVTKSQIKPTLRGGVQFEWEHNGAGLTIEIDSPLRVGIYFEYGNLTHVTQADLLDLAPLEGFLDQLMPAKK